jgi:hypothetical protein
MKKAKDMDVEKKGQWTFVSNDAEFDYPRICREAAAEGFSLLAVQRGVCHRVTYTKEYATRIYNNLGIRSYKVGSAPVGYSGGFRGAPVSAFPEETQKEIMLYPMFSEQVSASPRAVHEALLRAEELYLARTIVTGV